MSTDDLRQVAALCAYHGFMIPAGITEAIERARVVGVLDAWAASDDEHYWVSGPQYFGKSHYCTLWHAGDDKRVAGPFQGETPDEARSLAAKAISAGEL